MVLNFICLLLFWVLFIAPHFWHHDFLVFNITEEPLSVFVIGVGHASDCANHGLACLAQADRYPLDDQHAITAVLNDDLGFGKLFSIKHCLDLRTIGLGIFGKQSIHLRFLLLHVLVCVLSYKTTLSKLSFRFFSFLLFLLFKKLLLFRLIVSSQEVCHLVFFSTESVELIK